MKELKINDLLTLKYKEGLTETDYITLIEMSMEAYLYGIAGNIDNVGLIKYNPIKAHQMFHRVLFTLCIEEYDDSKYDEYFTLGVHKMLLENVVNAQDAKDYLSQLMSSSADISQIIQKFLDDLLGMIDSKLLDGGEMEKLLKKLPKDFSKIFNGYQKMINPKKEDKEEKIK